MNRLSLTITMFVAISACAPVDTGPHARPEPGDRPPPQIQHLNFDVIDVNHNDKISRDEFVAARFPAPAGESHPDKDEMFNRIDRDNSDFITRTELDEYRFRPY